MLPDGEPNGIREPKKEPASRRLPPIFTPEDFDRLIGEDPSWKDRAAGFSTVSLRHLRPSLMSPQFSINTWFDGQRSLVNMSLNGNIYRHIYPEGGPDENNFPENMYENRNYYPLWTIPEIYNEIEPDHNYEETMEVLEPVMAQSVLLIRAVEKGPIRSFGELIQALEFPEILEPDDRRAYIEDLNILKNAGFSTEENFFEFLNEIPRRKGIQIIYGPNDRFRAFLDQQEQPKKVDDNGIELHSSIPGDLVLGIIPLGEYEKEILT